MLLFSAYVTPHLECPGSGPQLSFSIENQKPTPYMLFTRGMALPSVGEQALGQKDLSSRTALTLQSNSLRTSRSVTAAWNHISDVTLSHKAGIQEVFIPLPRTNMQIQLLFYTQPLTKDKELRKWKRRKQSPLFSLQFHSVTLLPFKQVSIQFLLWWQGPSHS